MKTRGPLVIALTVVMLCSILAGRSVAAGQTSRTYRVVADVFTGANAGLAVGASRCQASLSVGQSAIAGRQASATFSVPEGYQATTEGFDTDYDGVPDSVDADDDGDGVPDVVDGRPYDTDGDGMNNIGDPDDDNEGLPDEEEHRFGTSWIDPNTDDDAHDDYEEWIAGTDDTDSNSFFRIVDVISRADGMTRIEWAGVQGRTYTLLATNELTGAASWETLWSTNVAVSGATAYEHLSSLLRRYYSVIVRRTSP